jgi:hypothetical protein
MAQSKDSATLADLEHFVLGRISTVARVPVVDQIASALNSSTAHAASLIAARPAYTKLVEADVKYIKQLAADMRGSPQFYKTLQDCANNVDARQVADARTYMEDVLRDPDGHGPRRA